MTHCEKRLALSRDKVPNRALAETGRENHPTYSRAGMAQSTCVLSALRAELYMVTTANEIQPAGELETEMRATAEGGTIDNEQAEADGEVS